MITIRYQNFILMADASDYVYPCKPIYIPKNALVVKTMIFKVSEFSPIKKSSELLACSPRPLYAHCTETRVRISDKL